MKHGKQKVTNSDPTVNSNAPQARIQQPQDAYLAWLPKELLQKEIGQYLSSEDKYYLSRESYSLHSLFKQPASKHVHQFLTAVVRGEKNEVEAFLDKNPSLLLEKIQVTDEAGRKIYGTAFQIALGAKDVSPFPDQFDEMAEMIAGYFEKIANGEKEKQNQYNEQFPEGFDKLEKERKIQDSKALNTVFAAIKNATTIAQAKAAVRIFQDYLKKQTQGVIKTGYHFNEALFEEALLLYRKYFDTCGGHNSDKNNLAAVKVLGGIQCYFTGSLAQATCDGIGKVIYKKKMLSRSKFVEDYVISSFIPKLGVNHFVYSSYGSMRKRGDILISDQVSLVWSKYISYINNNLKTHASTLSSSKPRCVIS